MDTLLTLFDWVLGGLFGKRATCWAKRFLIALLLSLLYFAPIHDIIWMANAIGQWKIGPFLQPFEHIYHVRVATP
jgi:hypothetical protein